MRAPFLHVESLPLTAGEVAMGSSSGRLVSGTMSNLFIGQGGEYVTPLLDRSGVAAAMRAVALREPAVLALAERVRALAD